MNFRFFRRKPPAESADVLPVAGLKEAVAAGRQEPDRRIQNPHLASVHQYGRAYIAMVLGNILPAPYATIECSIAIMVRYDDRCPRNTIRAPPTSFAARLAISPAVQLVQRTRQLAGLFPSTPMIFSVDQVSCAFLRSTCRLQKRRALWENQVTPEHVSLGVASLLADFEAHTIVLPSYRRKCNPAIESIRNELGELQPEVSAFHGTAGRHRGRALLLEICTESAHRV